MATKLRAVDVAGEPAPADDYLNLLGSLDHALQEERAAHRRLMALARRIERGDERRAAAAD